MIGPPHYRTDILPRQAQLEALEQLAVTWDEGYDKALVVMATGLGKTYLAAMFATKFRRVLFIAHREELLFQAQNAFQLVMPERSILTLSSSMSFTMLRLSRIKT